ncbi:hypothetical protein, partial [Bhargavaea ullalensis]|uniref:hypothetical protein n=1 Tax=Bhargavaea ullalensis TaxID=1265685 RepID=UPI003391C681
GTPPAFVLSQDQTLHKKSMSKLILCCWHICLTCPNHVFSSPDGVGIRKQFYQRFAVQFSRFIRRLLTRFGDFIILTPSSIDVNTFFSRF